MFNRMIKAFVQQDDQGFRYSLTHKELRKRRVAPRDARLCPVPFIPGHSRA
jgi:hypothetical protein